MLACAEDVLAGLHVAVSQSRCEPVRMDTAAGLAWALAASTLRLAMAEATASAAACAAKAAAATSAAWICCCSAHAHPLRFPSGLLGTRANNSGEGSGGLFCEVGLES